MMIFTTKYLDEDGITWIKDEYRIQAINWRDAEEQAEMMGVELVGQLREEQILDDEGNVIETINYDNIQNN